MKAFSPSPMMGVSPGFGRVWLNPPYCRAQARGTRRVSSPVRDPPHQFGAVDLAAGERHGRRLQNGPIQGHARNARRVRGGELCCGAKARARKAPKASAVVRLGLLGAGRQHPEHVEAADFLLDRGGKKNGGPGHNGPISNHPRRPIASLSQNVAQAGQTPPFQGCCSPSLWPRPANLRRHRFAGRAEALKKLAEVGRDEILAAAARLWEAGKEPTQSAVLKRMKEAERKEASHGAWGFALEVAGPNDSGHVRRPRSRGPADPSQP